jgi:bifunctional NMN adenylyltransferase/nudix hydrolase
MKIGFIIGRFQVPRLHAGHQHLIKSAYRQCDKLIILLGSANKASSVKNPYTFRERVAKITSVLPSMGLDAGKVSFLPLNDYKYSDSQWMADVSATMHMCLRLGDTPILFGHFKDGNNYLNWFPQFQFINIKSDIDIDGTRFRQQNMADLPASVQADYKYFEQEQTKFANYPYRDSLNICCGDAVLECSGHVLLIKRGSAPGIGNWGFPGGHKLTGETFLDCAFRELDEETNVRVPMKVLCGSIKATRLFDDPTRSSGIPKITLAVHIVIQSEPDGSLPRTQRADDASETKWVPIDDALNKYVLHDDHGDILSEMTGARPLLAAANQHI